MSKTVYFKVKSNRTQDIELEDNRTAYDLKDILGGNGLDVDEATILVNRFGKKFIGRLNLLPLEDDDAVEYLTTKVELPAHISKIKHNAVTRLAKMLGLSHCCGACEKPQPEITAPAPAPTKPGKKNLVLEIHVNDEGVFVKECR